MGKDMETDVKTKKSKVRKSKKKRKSDPVVNDISTLLSNSLSLISPNGEKDSETVKSPKKKNRKKKSFSRNASSNSLDSFVIRTPKECKNKHTIDKHQEKENENAKSKGNETNSKKNAFQFMMGSRNKSLGVKRKTDDLDFDNIEEIPKKPKISTNSNNFLELFTEKIEEEIKTIEICNSGDEEKTELKIKMFSPQVFKRRKAKSRPPEDTTEVVTLRRSARKKVPSKRFTITSETEDSNDAVVDVERDFEEKQSRKKRYSKVAPVFLNATPKPKPDPEVSEAKRRFLNGGIPEVLKKAIEKVKMFETEFDIFPKISHVQQTTQYKDSNPNFFDLPLINTLNIIDFKTSPIKIKTLSKGDLTNQKQTEINRNQVRRLESNVDPSEIVGKIKSENPDYPVIKTFRKLNRKKRKSQFDLWTEKFKSVSHEDILGNNKKVTELRNWLENWIENVSNQNKDSSSDEEFTISGDHAKGLSSGLVVVGPNGSGKTMSIYALCNQLGINVIELNASSKRTGKRLLQELQEATQSHQVGIHNKNGIKSNLSTPKHNNLSLLLIEDLDLIFDQDDGFLTALNQLLLTSKRPMIITTSDPSSNHLQKFISQYPIIEFSALTPKTLSIWFQIVCLLEGVVLNATDLGKVLEFFNGDVRRTLLQLEFYIDSGGIIYEELIYNFLDKNCLVYDLSFEKIWWNLPVISESMSLKKLLNLNESFCVLDTVYRRSDFIERHHNFVSDQINLKDSVELSDRIEDYKNREVLFEITEALMRSSMDSYDHLDLGKPTLGQKRWLKKQKDCRENFSELIPLSNQLDGRSYALDYFPALRQICRSETDRAKVNVKRNNRFYHYLKGLDFRVSDSTNETACSTLSIRDETDESTVIV